MRKNNIERVSEETKREYVQILGLKSFSLPTQDEMHEKIANDARQLRQNQQLNQTRTPQPQRTFTDEQVVAERAKNAAQLQKHNQELRILLDAREKQRDNQSRFSSRDNGFSAGKVAGAAINGAVNFGRNLADPANLGGLAKTVVAAPFYPLKVVKKHGPDLAQGAGNALRGMPPR